MGFRYRAVSVHSHSSKSYSFTFFTTLLREYERNNIPNSSLACSQGVILKKMLKDEIVVESLFLPWEEEKKSQ